MKFKRSKSGQYSMNSIYKVYRCDYIYPIGLSNVQTHKLNYEQSSFTHLCNGVLRLPSLLSMTTPYRTRSSTNVKWPCLAAKWSGDLDATQSMASMSAPCRNSKSTTPSWPATQATWRAVVPSLSLSLTKSLKEVNPLEAYGMEKIMISIFVYASAFNLRFDQSL